MAATGRTDGYTAEQQTSTCSSSSLVNPHSTFIATKPSATFVSLQSPGYGSLGLRSPTSAYAACYVGATSDLDSCFTVSVEMWFRYLAAVAYCPSKLPFGGGYGSGLNFYKGLMPI